MVDKKLLFAQYLSYILVMIGKDDHSIIYYIVN